MSPKQIICSICKDVMAPRNIFNTLTGSCCQECKNKPEVTEEVLQTYPCPNYGCSYNAKDEYSLRKHYKWLCKFQESTCKQCKDVFKNMSLMDHYIKSDKHQIIDLVQEGDICALNIDKLDVTRKNLFISAFNITFRAFYEISETHICISVVSTLKSNETKKFHLSLKILPKETSTYNELFEEKFQNIITMPHNNNVHTYDWRACICLDDTIITSKDYEKYNLKLFIKKSELH